VHDGTPIDSSYTDEDTVSNLHFTMNSSFPGGMDAFRAKVAEAFARWSEITNITYVEVSDDGAPMPNAPGLLGARGDIRIGMHAIGEGPLAYNFYPLFGGDMVLDSLDMATFADSTGDYRASAQRAHARTRARIGIGPYRTGIGQSSDGTVPRHRL
jgi:hypothetical protein